MLGETKKMGDSDASRTRTEDESEVVLYEKGQSRVLEKLRLS